ncbi:hypothetical protein Tsubulata_022566 [Turnera subulata]|uniref:DUF4283 domain-containing protein n=1 Tax=Turnera subulata TaxID=218843 RepID=A0A9Q0JQM5_9ROSI|nr:hypothetical protein Tsubulata_022566 [Turnera subulata]
MTLKGKIKWPKVDEAANTGGKTPLLETGIVTAGGPESAGQGSASQDVKAQTEVIMQEVDAATMASESVGSVGEQVDKSGVSQPVKRSFRDVTIAQTEPGPQESESVDWDEANYEEGDIIFVEGRYGRAIELSAAFEKRLDDKWQREPWYTAFRASEGKINRVVVWVRFPEFPLSRYHPRVLKALTSLVGEPLKIDLHTKEKQRGKFARMAVEVDLLKPLRGKVEMQG